MAPATLASWILLVPTNTSCPLYQEGFSQKFTWHGSHNCVLHLACSALRFSGLSYLCDQGETLGVVSQGPCTLFCFLFLDRTSHWNMGLTKSARQPASELRDSSISTPYTSTQFNHLLYTALLSSSCTTCLMSTYP